MTNCSTLPQRKRTRTALYPITIQMREPELLALEAAADKAGLSRAEAVRRGIVGWLATQIDQETR